MKFSLTPEQNQVLHQLEASLQTNKIRLTKGRRDILRVILTANHPTFNDVVENLERATQEKPNIMSVYNTINMLLAHGIIYANTFDGRQISYEVKIPQAGHLKCDRCLQMIHLDQLDNFNHEFQKLAAQYQWNCDYFKLEIHGLCPECRSDSAQ